MLPLICLCLFGVQDLLFLGGLAEAKPYVSATVSYCEPVTEIKKKIIHCAISGIRNMLRVKKIKSN